jgi:conjugal transfer mating pair stabilization protein TraG
MAGYLMITIPFIAGSLVTGMAYAFNTAAAYIGGVLQSSATSAASEVASGNISLGMASWGNVNANKFDTNASLMRNQSTEQLDNGVLRTTRPDGEPVYDSSHTISRLPVSVKASDMLSESFSSQAEAANSAAIQDQKSYDQSISNAVTDVDSFGKSLGSNQNIGENFTSREAASSAQSASDMRNMAQTIADRNHLDVNDVFKGLVNFSQGGSLGGNATLPGKSLGINIVEGKLDGKLSTEHTRVSETTTQHGIGRSIDLTAEEANRFSNDLHKVEEYSKTSHVDTNQSTAASYLSQLSTDLRQARSTSEQHQIHRSESERLSQSASFVKQHSGQIDSDLSQGFADYVVNKEGRAGAESLFGGKDRTKLEAYGKEYVISSGVENQILSTYQQSSSNINPDKQYQSGISSINDKTSNIVADHEKQIEKNIFDANTHGVGVDRYEFQQLQNSVEKHQEGISSNLKQASKDRSEKYGKINTEVNKNLKEGTEKANSSAYNMNKSVKPGFLTPDKKK